MRKISWFLVGFLYFALIWLNRYEVNSTQIPSWSKDLGLVGILGTWSFIVSLACSQTWEPSQIIRSPKMRRLAASGMGALLIQYTLGALSRHFNAGLACPNFPTCADGFLPSDALSTLAFIHRWWGVLMLGLFMHLSVAALKTAPELLSSARRASALSVAQIFLGIGVVMTQLHSDSRLCHVAIGYALWGILVYILARTGGLRQPQTSAI